MTSCGQPSRLLGSGTLRNRLADAVQGFQEVQMNGGVVFPKILRGIQVFKICSAVNFTVSEVTTPDR